MKLPVANQPWVTKAVATAAMFAVVALWGGGPVRAQDAGITPARQNTTASPASASAPAASGSHGGNPLALFNQVQMLKQQNRDLLGQIEQLQHQLDQLKEISKEQYIALDTRLKRLENNQSASAPAQAGSTGSAGGKNPPAASSAATAASTPATTTAPASSAPASAGTAPGSDSGAQQAYSTAFNALRAGHFAESAREFRAFIKQYPHAKLTPNAWYWLGESYYVTQNYKPALSAFEAVLRQFPQSGKAPGALLKKGFSQYALKQTDAARATLKSVVTKYPNSSVANLAKQRLDDIRLQQQLN